MLVVNNLTKEEILKFAALDRVGCVTQPPNPRQT